MGCSTSYITWDVNMFPRASIFKTSAFIFHERFKINFEGSSIHAHCLLLFIVSYGLLLLSIRIVASQKIKYEQVLTGFGFFKTRSFEFEQTKRCMWCRKSKFTWHQYIFIRFRLYSLLPHSTFFIQNNSTTYRSNTLE